MSRDSKDCSDEFGDWSSPGEHNRKLVELLGVYLVAVFKKCSKNTKETVLMLKKKTCETKKFLLKYVTQKGYRK